MCTNVEQALIIFTCIHVLDVHWQYNRKLSNHVDNTEIRILSLDDASIHFLRSGASRRRFSIPFRARRSSKLPFPLRLLPPPFPRQVIYREIPLNTINLRFAYNSIDRERQPPRRVQTLWERLKADIQAKPGSVARAECRRNLRARVNFQSIVPPNGIKPGPGIEQREHIGFNGVSRWHGESSLSLWNVKLSILPRDGFDTFRYFYFR